MGYGEPDVYYSPEKFGLTQIAEVELSEPCYSFDMLVVWKDAQGNKYSAQDAGCSCPSPFEDYTSIEMLDRLDINAIELMLKDNTYLSPDDKRQFLEKIKE